MQENRGATPMGTGWTYIRETRVKIIKMGNNSEPRQTAGLPELYTCTPITAMVYPCSLKNQILQTNKQNKNGQLYSNHIE